MEDKYSSLLEESKDESEIYEEDTGDDNDLPPQTKPFYICLIPSYPKRAINSLTDLF